jgi:hypothetical protein
MLAAESALASMLSPQTPALPDSIGVEHAVTTRFRTSSPSVVAYVTRLDSTTFWVVAEVPPDPDRSAARRRIGIVARTARSPDGSLHLAPVSPSAWSELF